MIRTPPTRERLLDYARQFARELHGIEPPEAALAERIEYVVWGRKQGWVQVEDGLMSRAELRQLLIDHFDYECADVSGLLWAQFDEALRARFCAELDRVLFGDP